MTDRISAATHLPAPHDENQRGHQDVPQPGSVDGGLGLPRTEVRRRSATDIGRKKTVVTYRPLRANGVIRR